MGDDASKKLILARRARFVAAALASVAATTTGLAASVEACGGEVTESDAGQPQPCLSPTARPEPCLTQQRDASPEPCLAPRRPDAGADADAGDAGDGGNDAEPQPCLAPRP